MWNGFHICQQLQRHSTHCLRIYLSIGLGKQVSQQEMTIGTEHIAFAHQLFYFFLACVRYLTLVFNDIISYINDMPIATPVRSSCRSGRSGIIPPPYIKIRTVIFGRSSGGRHRQLITSKGGKATIFGKCGILIGKHLSIFLTCLGNHFTRRSNVKKVVTACQHCQQSQTQRECM